MVVAVDNYLLQAYILLLLAHCTPCTIAQTETDRA